MADEARSESWLQYAWVISEITGAFGVADLDPNEITPYKRPRKLTPSREPTEAESREAWKLLGEALGHKRK